MTVFFPFIVLNSSVDTATTEINSPNAGKTMSGRRVSPAWKAVEKAQQAAEAVIDEGMKNVPKPTDYMVRRQITFDPNRGSSINLGF